MPVFISATKELDAKAKDIDITMISANVYYATCYLKKAQVFAILMKDIEYQAEKEVRA